MVGTCHESTKGMEVFPRFAFPKTNILHLKSDHFAERKIHLPSSKTLGAPALSFRVDGLTLDVLNCCP